METVLGWHFVGSTLRDGRPTPPDGEWLRHDGPVEICESGLHASERVIDALKYAPGATVCRVECRDIRARQGDKLVAAERRILWRIDAGDLLRDFARWCAWTCFDKWSPPSVVAEYVETGDVAKASRARLVAWSASESARLVAWSAAESARSAAARSAAAWSAESAWSAARSAAAESAAAESAAAESAWSAARSAVAAVAAESAAESAAVAAESAAESARSAWSAAVAAESARSAWSVAAWSAAESAAAWSAAAAAADVQLSSMIEAAHCGEYVKWAP